MCFLVFLCFAFRSIAGYGYPEIDQFSGNNTWRLVDFRVLLPRNWSISGKDTWKSINFQISLPGGQILWEKNPKFKFLISYKNFKSEYKYKNQLWTVCTYIGLGFESKRKWGYPKAVFPISGYRYLEVGNFVVNISAKMKIFWGVTLGH